MNALLITVRTNSARLPDKALLKIKGKHTIEYVIANCKKSKLAEKIILCTTTLKEDEVLCDIAKHHDIECFQGSVKDKLSRWNGACLDFGVDFFVTADGDDLFCSSELMDLAFDQYRKKKSHFIQAPDVICGAFAYAIRSDILRRVCDAKKINDTEMMWKLFENDFCQIEELENIPQVYKRKDMRFTLDYQEDFLFFSKVIEQLDNPSNTPQIIEYLNSNPELKDINFFRERDWELNQEKAIINMS